MFFWQGFLWFSFTSNVRNYVELSSLNLQKTVDFLCLWRNVLCIVGEWPKWKESNDWRSNCTLELLTMGLISVKIRSGILAALLLLNFKTMGTANFLGRRIKCSMAIDNCITEHIKPNTFSSALCEHLGWKNSESIGNYVVSKLLQTTRGYIHRWPRCFIFRFSYCLWSRYVFQKQRLSFQVSFRLAWKQ